jgi:hypothetical protein
MERSQLEDMLKSVEAQAVKAGFWEMPKGRLINLNVARQGVGFTVSRGKSLEFLGDLAKVRTEKGDITFVHLAEIFAVSIEGGEISNARKAGFV